MSSVLIRIALVAAVLCSGIPSVQPVAAQSSASKSQSSKKPAKPGKKVAAKKRSRSSPRLRRMHQAFVASASLKPMARQLLQDRTPAAYAGVEAYARRHTKEDAGALAWLVLGYAHVLDHDYAKAVDPLNRAKPLAGDLGDYVSLYLGTSYFQSGRTAEAVATLSEFDQAFPESLLTRDVHVLYASALLAESRSQDVISLLEKDRLPPRADLEFTLGRAYAAAGQPAKAIEVFRNLYVTMPLSPEATQADAELKKLASAAPIPPLGVDGRRTRADLLAKGKRFNDAADEYRDLLNVVNANDRADVELALAVALRRSGQNKEAKKVLDSLPATNPEINAQRLYNLGEVARATDDDEGFLRNLGELRQAAPTSFWLQQALLTEGNFYLLKPDYDKAIDAYRELQQRFPNAGRASYAHWKVAWLSLRQGRNAEAKTGFEQQIGLYPTSAEVPAALYWRARLAEEDNDSAMARAYYQKLSERFRNFYYGELARQRLREIKAQDDPPHYALLDRVPAINEGTNIVVSDPPTDNLRYQKAQLLENGGLVDFAVRELQAAGNEDKGNWVTAETARLYQDAGRYDGAIQVFKRAVPNYFAVDLPTLPRFYWEALFPKPYWTDLKRFSSQNALDPYLVASLIRQESEFNPGAVSRANAVGLMQLLPKVGRTVARQEKLRHFSTTELFKPEVNLQLGTRYFREMVDKFGAFEYALAAYNAGSNRVDDWQGQGKYRDPQEFVESIPFTETREYVQAILRNANVYRQLYGTP
ncbi:MAG TPA: transglycosylase SLT domain-containing protein [Terriglobales bacterium]|nr:transglycosylase SLT domain-containing protein [Terriglobales bacterium]